jgi:hypothetical protein
LKQGIDVSLSQVKRWLRGQEHYTLFKQGKPVKQRIPFFVPNELHTLQADLLDMQGLSNANDGIKYILTGIDVFSKKGYACGLTSKEGAKVADGLLPMLAEGFLFLHTDKGREFYNNRVKVVLKNLQVIHYSTENDNIKAGTVERFNRTLREVLIKYMTLKREKRYIDILDEVITTYNSSPSRDGMVPSQFLPKDANEIWIRRFEREFPKSSQRRTINVGDYVRILNSRRSFSKVSDRTWSTEVFKVRSVNDISFPLTFCLEDLMGENIEGRFYEEELQVIDFDADADFEIEKTIKTRKRGGKVEHLVKWLGYPDKFNSWIEKDLIS